MHLGTTDFKVNSRAYKKRHVTETVGNAVPFLGICRTQVCHTECIVTWQHVRSDTSRERRQELTVAKLPHRELYRASLTHCGHNNSSRRTDLCEPRKWIQNTILYAINSLVVYSVPVRHWFDKQAKRAMIILLRDRETNFCLSVWPQSWSNSYIALNDFFNRFVHVQVCVCLNFQLPIWTVKIKHSIILNISANVLKMPFFRVRINYNFTFREL